MAWESGEVARIKVGSYGKSYRVGEDSISERSLEEIGRAAFVVWKSLGHVLAEAAFDKGDASIEGSSRSCPQWNSLKESDRSITMRMKVISVLIPVVMSGLAMAQAPRVGKQETSSTRKRRSCRRSAVSSKPTYKSHSIPTSESSA